MIEFAQVALTYLLSFLAVLTLVVTVHELGHFLVAKACGVAIDRFAIGFGRAILSWRDRSGVEWRIGWIPLGGYVRFSGDENAASVPDHEDLASMRSAFIAKEGHAGVSRYFHFFYQPGQPPRRLSNRRSERGKSISYDSVSRRSDRRLVPSRRLRLRR